tara:strand:- start:7586 stop:8929 length:1344 start_codon:yes stop_codon:yes gene_type:complete
MSSNVNLEITPSNVLSNGRVSFHSGNPVISFIIGEQERSLIGQSVRLCGKFRAYKTTGTDQATDRAVTEADTISMNSRTGVYGCIDQLVIKSQRTHQTIEHVKHYGRFASTFLPSTNSVNDGITHMSESSLAIPNYALFKQSVLDLPSQQTTQNSFCCPLPCGLLNGVTNIPLSADWGLQGLLIEIHLSPDANVLFSSTGVDASVTAMSNAFYEFSDLKLVCEAVNPTPQMVAQMPSTFEYNSISSYFTSINSTQSVINFNLGLSRVLGVFCNFIESNKINNLEFDGLGTDHLINKSSGGVLSSAQIRQLVFTRGGIRFPLEYNIDYLGIDGTTHNEVDAQVNRNFMNAIKPFAQNQKVMVSPVNTFSISNEGVVSGRDVLNVDGGSVFGVGINYDSISDQGVDFSNVQWGMNMTTDLDTNNPHAVYVFVHAKSTLAFNSSGLQVMN